MKTFKVIYYLIILLFIIGLNGTIRLVYAEMTVGAVCPTLLGIPACYIILACFTSSLVAHLYNPTTRYYFIGVGLAWGIAIVASILQWLAILQCPKTDTGIPMCYISLALFTGLIGLKMITLPSNTR